MTTKGHCESSLGSFDECSACPLSSMGSMTVLHIPDVVLQSFCKLSRNSSCQGLWIVCVCQALCSFMTLSGYLQCTCCENSQVLVLGYFLYVPVSIISMNRVMLFVLLLHMHNFALVWVEPQLPVSRPDTEGVKIFLEISSIFYTSYSSPYFGIISKHASGKRCHRSQDHFEAWLGEQYH